MPATVLMSETKPCLTTAWSSITMMRILLLTVQKSSIIQRHIDNDLCSAFFRALNRQHAIHLPGTFPHADQTEVTISDLLTRIKAAAIVANAKPHVARVKV